jgi:cytochrome c peroxidase
MRRTKQLLVVAGAMLAVPCLATLSLATISSAPTPSAPTSAGEPLAVLQRLYKRPVIAAGQPRNDPVWRIGEQLFFDPRLSASNSLSCAGCHQPQSGWTDHRARSQGDTREPLPFRSPTLLNAGLLDRYGWIGRFRDIQAVSCFAISSAMNMNLALDVLIDRLKGDRSYRQAFEVAFPDKAVSKQNIGAALTAFVASIVSAPSPFDRWIDGDEAAIGPEAKRGFLLFNGKAQCAQCHSGWAFTDGSFHDIGTATGDDIGRGRLFPTSVKLRYAFKTPTLRDVARRDPYTHDGGVATLAAMIDVYDKGGIDRPSRAEAIRPLHLDASEKADLLAFLATLSGPSTFARIEP